MAYTVLQFLTDALADSGKIQAGQTPTGTVAQVARQVHYQMVKSWSTNRLRRLYVPEVLYTLSASKGSYQIGPGAADFDTNPGVYVKPVFIQAARVLVGTGRLWPLNILTRPEWDVVQGKNLDDPDGPLDFFYDYGTPIATFNVSPKPIGAQSMWVTQWNPLRAFEIGEEQLFIDDFYPQELIEPMRRGLAINLMQTYKLPMDQELPAIFQASIGEFERMNNDLLSGAFGPSRTLSSPMKGDGGPIGAAPPQGQ